MRFFDVVELQIMPTSPQRILAWLSPTSPGAEGINDLFEDTQLPRYRPDEKAKSQFTSLEPTPDLDFSTDLIFSLEQPTQALTEVEPHSPTVNLDFSAEDSIFFLEQPRQALAEKEPHSPTVNLDFSTDDLILAPAQPEGIHSIPSTGLCFDNGIKITDPAILATYTQEGQGRTIKYYITVDGAQTRVFVPHQLTQSRLFHNGKQITDPAILATRTQEGKGSSSKYYVTLEGIKTRVFKAHQLSTNRLFHNGKQITEQAILNTYTHEGNGRSSKHYVILNGTKTQVFTANQLTQHRLFYQGEQITDPAILRTYTKEKGKHYLTGLCS